MELKAFKLISLDTTKTEKTYKLERTLNDERQVNT